MIEDWLADIHLHFAGLASATDRDAALRALAGSEEAHSWPFRQLIRDLGDQDPPPVADIGLFAAAALAEDEAAARNAVTALHDAARAVAPQLWAWFSRVRGEAGGWRERTRAAVGPFDTPRLWAPAPQQEPGRAAEAARALAAMAGLTSEGCAEHQWRRSQQGAFLSKDVPPFADALHGVSAALQTMGVLPKSHTVRTISSVPTRAASVPIMIPGQSVLVVHDSGHASALQYIHHELAHVAEHGCRSTALPLTDRWSFDPVLSEGWALLLESLVQDTEWLAVLGVEETCARRLAAFFRAEETLNRELIRARVRFDDFAEDAADFDALLEAAAGATQGLGVAYDPWVFVLGLANAVQWRAYEAGYRWRDEVVTALHGLSGPGPWWDGETAWQLLRGMLSAPVGAEAALWAVTAPAVAAERP